MAVSCEISWTDRCLFGLSSWLNTRSSTVTRWTRSAAAWLPDCYCTRLAVSLQQTVCASKFPTLVGQFTQRFPCTTLLWLVEIFKIKIATFCETFMIFFNFYWYLGLEFPKVQKIGVAEKYKQLSMAYTLGNKCTKNCCKRTILVQLMVEDVATCFFLEHSLVVLSTHCLVFSTHSSQLFESSKLQISYI